MNSDKYRDFLLKMIPTAKVGSGGRVVNCRCFYCPDGKSKSSRHFGISIPQSDTEPSLYHCFKCHAAGIVTYKTLIDWGIYEDGLAMELIEHNAKLGKNKEFRSKYIDKIRYNVSNTITEDNEITRVTLKYINDRLGTDFTYEELRQLKIVLNLNDLLRCNNIEKLTRSQSIVEQLDLNFLGFLSIDNAYLNMRRLCKEGLVYESIDKRYINYKLFDKFDTSERFYTIPTSIDINSPERIKIHIAEGPFDILSVYRNLRNMEPGIYTSIAGSNYKGIAMYFLEVYKLPYVELHFYPDNDQSNEVIEKIAKYVEPMLIPVYIHRNIKEGEKDFGVSKENIIESIQQL